MSNTEQIAHVRVLEDGSYETQPLLEHLHGVAELAQSYAERIIYVIPYTSIITQTAQTFSLTYTKAIG